MKTRVVSLVPEQFRVGQAPNFSEMADVIYSFPGTAYCSSDDIIANAEHLEAYMTQRFGQVPSALVVYEPWDRVVFDVLSRYKVRIILITEDLHLRSLSLLRSAVEASHLVLARFNVINEILGTSFAHIRSFPLHCSPSFLHAPNFESEDKIVHFGNLHTDAPNINPALSPDANQYEFRREWHELFLNRLGEKYKHIRLPPAELFEYVRSKSFGFACTYFPYSFRDNCAEEQGEGWAAVNRVHDGRKSYLVAKYFEIPGGGQLLLADPTGVESSLREAGFVDRQNYVAIRRDTVDETLGWIYDASNSDRVREIRQRGFELVRDHHSLDARKGQYARHVVEVISGK